ncbi:MAG: hypothetical protein MO847_02230 [Candidatus Protistobacter heckmanni]|nr:hypothetical protein [Candidatus Protistobacter heckmanni]
MKKNMLEIYALAVCFVAASGFVVTLAIALYNTLALARPDFAIPAWQYTLHQDNDAFWNHGCVGRNFCAPEERRGQRPPEPELTRQREEAYARVLASEGREASQNLVKCLAVFLAMAGAFALHWRLAKRVRETAN